MNIIKDHAGISIIFSNEDIAELFAGCGVKNVPIETMKQDLCNVIDVDIQTDITCDLMSYIDGRDYPKANELDDLGLGSGYGDSELDDWLGEDDED